jgi:rod shape-determining protein MreB
MLNAFRPVIYVQISPDRLTVRNVKSGEAISEVPEIAIAGGSARTVLAVGAEARSAAATQAAEIVNPFRHPRSLVGDFSLGEQVLKAFIRRLQSRSFLSFPPLVVLHPLGSHDGGLTQVERSALREMAMGAGAAKVVLWVGEELADADVLSERVLRSKQ